MNQSASARSRVGFRRGAGRSRVPGRRAALVGQRRLGGCALTAEGLKSNHRDTEGTETNLMSRIGAIGDNGTALLLLLLHYAGNLAYWF